MQCAACCDYFGEPVKQTGFGIVGHCLSAYRPQKASVSLRGTADAGDPQWAAAPVGGHVDCPEQKTAQGLQFQKKVTR